MVYLNFMDHTSFTQSDFNEKPKFNKKRSGVIVLILSLAIIGYFSFMLGSSSNTIEVQNKPAPFWQRVANIFRFASEPIDPDYIMPAKDDNRLNVLVLGMEGSDDINSNIGGPLLTDSMMLFSYNKTSDKAAVVSIPRDIYVKIDLNTKKTGKLNELYEYGYYHKNGGISYVEEMLSRITGIHIDKTVMIDFTAFKKLIDEVGGIDISLAQPFEEDKQWSYKFYLPAGPNHLDGEQALYYARSRFSSSDFDRARRQQEILFALKDKFAKLNFWSDPIKAVSILNTVHSNITTDFNIWDTKSLLSLAKNINSSNIKKYGISTDNLLYESRDSSGSYILLPKGDNFMQIKQFFKDNLK